MIPPAAGREGTAELLASVCAVGEVAQPRIEATNGSQEVVREEWPGELI